MSASVPTVVLFAADWHEATWRPQLAREKLRVLSRLALARAAREAGAPNGPWDKHESGAPAPLGQWRWSVSHSGGFAAAALGRVVRLGVDVEPLTRTPSAHVGERLAALGVSAGDARSLLEAWCRVEAALKAHGVGLVELGSVRVDGSLVHVGDSTVQTRVFELEGALLAVAGGGVCAMQPPVFERVAEVAA